MKTFVLTMYKQIKYSLIAILMKRLIIIIFCTCLLNTINAQDYIKFPQSAAIWNVIGDNDFSLEKYRIRIGLSGDTVIGSNTYAKVYWLYDSTLIHPNSEYFGALREDSNKHVFIKIKGQQEVLLYDFSVNIGDTIWYTLGACLGSDTIGFDAGPHNHYKVVLGIDSVMIYNNTFRKRISLLSSNFNTDKWIEGIGSIFWAGLLNPLISNYILNGDGYNFVCFKQDEEVLYLNNPYCNYCFCQLVSDIQNIENQVLDVSCYPNPLNENSVICFSNNYCEIFNLKIYTSVGTLIKEIASITNNKVPLNCEDFPQGIYIFELTGSKGVVKSGKFVVH